MSEHEYNELFRAIGKEASSKASLSLMPVCIASSLTTLKTLQISSNLP